MPDPTRAGGANPFEYRKPTDQQTEDIKIIRKTSRSSGRTAPVSTRTSFRSFPPVVSVR